MYSLRCSVIQFFVSARRVGAGWVLVCHVITQKRTKKEKSWTFVPLRIGGTGSNLDIWGLLVEITASPCSSGLLYVSKFRLLPPLVSVVVHRFSRGREHVSVTDIKST